MAIPVPPLGNGLVVSVNLDLAGDDVYSTSVPTSSGSEAVQGAGSNGGIGMLVDAAGDDVYGATATQTASYVVAQGAGWAGVGLLADLGGDDSYHVTNNTIGDGRTFPCVCATQYTYTYAQGYGALWAGLGVVLDRGGGDDTYAVEARPEWLVDEKDQIQGTSPNVYAFGSGVYDGGALWADDGGRDTATLVATNLASMTPDDPRRQNGFPNVRAVGVGVGVSAGAGVVLSGAGPTSWTIIGAVAGPYLVAPITEGFAHAGTAGYAAVYDEGGNDSYVIESSAEAEKVVSVDDTCRCTGVRSVASAAASVSANVAALGGVAVLHDRAGNDHYVAIATASAVASAADERTTPFEPDPVTEGDPPCVTNLAWEFAPQLANSERPCDGAIADVQTFAMASGWAGAGLAGASFLVDDEGDDVYRVDASSVARAHADTGTAAIPREGHARSHRSTTAGQAGAVGGFSELKGLPPGHTELRDGGGNDAYTSSATNSVSATPPTTETIVRKPYALVQAASDTAGTALLLDEGSGDEDVFVSTPPHAACQGTRGEGVWVDCGRGAGREGLGVGVNA